MNTFWCILFLSLPAAAQPQVKWVDWAGDYGRLRSVSFKTQGRPGGTADFEVKADTEFAIIDSYALRTQAGDKACVFKGFHAQGPRLEIEWGIDDVGTVDVKGDGNEQILVTSSGKRFDAYLNLVDPQTCRLVWLKVIQPDQATQAVQTAASSNLQDPALAPERAFLDRMKYRYGFVDVGLHPDDPEYAYYFWEKDNGAVNDGTLKIRKYKGRPPHPGSITDSLKVGPVTYSAEFKAGVFAYDEKAGEYYVLYHPEDRYHWPGLLRRAGPYLLIGTRGEGLVVINLKTSKMKRFPHVGQDDVVEGLEAQGSEVLINGSQRLSLEGI